MSEKVNDVMERMDHSNGLEAFVVRFAFDKKTLKPMFEIPKKNINPVYGTPDWKRKHGRDLEVTPK